MAPPVAPPSKVEKTERNKIQNDNLESDQRETAEENVAQKETVREESETVAGCCLTDDEDSADESSQWFEANGNRCCAGADEGEDHIDPLSEAP
nr:hypothetical protein Iba_chr09bCG14920 [Ipomoea batatas]